MSNSGMFDQEQYIARLLDGGCSHEEQSAILDAAARRPELIDALVTCVQLDDLLSQHAESSRGAAHARWLDAFLTGFSGEEATEGIADCGLRIADRKESGQSRTPPLCKGGPGGVAPHVVERPTPNVELPTSNEFIERSTLDVERSTFLLAHDGESGLSGQPTPPAPPCKGGECATLQSNVAAKRHSRWLAWKYPLAISAALVAAMCLATLGLGQRGLTKVVNVTHGRKVNKSLVAPVPVAHITRSINVEWPDGVHRWSVGEMLKEGDAIDFAAGRLEIVFDSGAVLAVVGPATMQIQSAAAVALQAGTLTARCEGLESGEFHVVTPSANVVDLGTEFGVRVERDGKMDVVVFDGAVDLRPVPKSRGDDPVSMLLSVGEALRANANGDWRRLVAVDNDAFPFGPAIYQDTRSRRPVILGISDDRRSAASPKFYRIYHAGLDEDARAFVDRVFEWNGAGVDGIPTFLRGADYIATFNDDKEGESPLISVELARPATLYLFYDDRMEVPGWLAQDFEDTGLDIGLDEGRRNLGAGPGVSIDQTCSIWRRRVPEAGFVKLGRIGVVKPEFDKPWLPSQRTMFGIAAQPE